MTTTAEDPRLQGLIESTRRNVNEIESIPLILCRPEEIADVALAISRLLFVKSSSKLLPTWKELDNRGALQIAFHIVVKSETISELINLAKKVSTENYAENVNLMISIVNEIRSDFENFRVQCDGIYSVISSRRLLAK